VSLDDQVRVGQEEQQRIVEQFELTALDIADHDGTRRIDRRLRHRALDRAGLCGSVDGYPLCHTRRGRDGLQVVAVPRVRIAQTCAS